MQEQQTLCLEYTCGFHEEVAAISDIGAYKALFRFGKPDSAPCRSFMSFEGRQKGVVRWQGWWK